MSQRGHQLVRWEWLRSTEVFSVKHTHGVQIRGAIVLALLLRLFERLLHLQRQLLSQDLDAPNGQFLTRQRAGQDQPLQAPRAASRECGTQHTAPALTKDVKARAVAEVEVIKEVLKLGDE